jgi:hypothetical protein
MVTALSQLVVWQGFPRGIFPEGDHVFPADLEALTSLVDALRADLVETHLVPVAELGGEGTRPLRLAHLRAFLETHRARLSAALGHEVVAANARAHGAQRVAVLRELNAPGVLIDDDVAELARVTTEAWAPEVDPFASVPDVLAIADSVDVASRSGHAIALDVDADITPVVLLALHCCIEANASSVQAPRVDDASWMPIPMFAEGEDLVPEGIVRVQPAIYADTIHELSFADARAFAEASRIAPGGALLRISIVASDDE